jgi:NTP pyrophosphatase (non-canonical NTP hydrolase)
MGEEMGELFKAVRRQLRYYDEDPAAAGQHEAEARKAHVAEELVDVLNYVMAIANRLEIDLEAAFVAKNALNQQRSWQK